MEWKKTIDDVVWWIRDTWRLLLEGRGVEVYNYEMARLSRKLQGAPNLHEVHCETRTISSYDEGSRASNTTLQPRHDVQITTCLVPYNSEPPTPTSTWLQMLPWVLITIIILRWLMIKCKFIGRKRSAPKVNDASIPSTSITPPPIHEASGSASSNTSSILNCADFVRKEDVTNLENSVFNKVYSQITTVVTPVVKTAVDASIEVGQAQSKTLALNQWDLAKSSSLQAARLEISQWFPDMLKMATEKVSEYIDEKVVPNCRLKMFELAHNLVKTSTSEFSKGQEEKFAQFESYHSAAQDIIRTEVRNANQKVDEVHIEVSGLRREVSDTHVRLRKFNSCAKEVLNMQGAVSKVESLVRKMETAENKIIAENEALTDHRRKMEEEKTSLETLNAKIIKDTANFDQSRADCAGDFAKLTKLRSTISKEVNELNQRRTKAKKMYDHLDAKEKSVTEKLGSTTEIAAKMEKMQKDMDEIRNRTVKESEATKKVSLDIAKDKKEVKALHDKTSTEAKNAKILHDQLAADMKTLKTSCETTKNASKATKESNERLTSQVDLFKLDTASLKEKVDSLEDLEGRVEENRKSNKENYLTQVKKHTALSRRVTTLEEKAPIARETQTASVPVVDKIPEENATSDQLVEVEAPPKEAAVLSPTDLPTTALAVDAIIEKPQAVVKSSKKATTTSAEAASPLPAKPIAESQKSSTVGKSPKKTTANSKEAAPSPAAKTVVEKPKPQLVAESPVKVAATQKATATQQKHFVQTPTLEVTTQSSTKPVATPKETTLDLAAKPISETPKTSSNTSADAVVALQTQITSRPVSPLTRAKKRQAGTALQAINPPQYPSIRLLTGPAIQAVKDKIAAEQAEEDEASGDSSSEESNSGESTSGESTSEESTSIAEAQDAPIASTSSETNVTPGVTQEASSSMSPPLPPKTPLNSEQSISAPQTPHKPVPTVSFVNGRPIRRPVRKAPTTNKKPLASPAPTTAASDSSAPADQIITDSSLQPSLSAPISNVASGVPGLGLELSKETAEEERITRPFQESAAASVLSQSPTRTKRSTALYEAKFTTSAEINFVDPTAPSSGLFQSHPVSFGLQAPNAVTAAPSSSLFQPQPVASAFQAPTAVTNVAPQPFSAFQFSAATVPAGDIATINIPAATHTSTPAAVRESANEMDPQHDWLTGPPGTSSNNAPAATTGLDISLGEDDDWLSGPSNTLCTSANWMTENATVQTQASAGFQPIIAAYTPVHYDPGAHMSAMQQDNPKFDQYCGFGDVSSGIAWNATENNHTSNNGGANNSNAPVNTPFDMSLIEPALRGTGAQECNPSQPSMVFNPQALQNNMMGTPFTGAFQNNFPNVQKSQWPASSSSTISPSFLISAANPTLPEFAPEPDELDFPINLTYPEPSNPTVYATGESFAQLLTEQFDANDPINFKSCDQWVLSGGDAGEWYAFHFPDEFGV